MKIIAIAIVIASAFSAGAAAANDMGSTHSQQAHTSEPMMTRAIHINCFRGPLHVTLWDHPQGTFISDLIAFGYDSANAEEIATSICKNESLVGKPDALKAALLEVIATTPPGQ